MRIPGRLIEHMAALQQAFVEPLVSLCRSHEADAAMAVFIAVPMDEPLHPLPRLLQARETIARPLWPVLQRTEQRFREGDM